MYQLSGEIGLPLWITGRGTLEELQSLYSSKKF